MAQPSNIKNVRIEWIDFSRGWVIILMVLGHTSIPMPISNYIWSFHMPFFFFISGLLFNPLKHNKFLSFLLERARRLIVPYFIMTAVVCFLLFSIGEPDAKCWYMGWGGYPLWFLPVLFIVEIFSFFAILKPHCRLPFAFCSYFIGYSLYLYGIHLPYKIEVVFMASTYYILGNLLKKQTFTYELKWRYLFLLFFVSIVLSQMLPRLDMCFNDYGSILNFFSAMMGIYSVILMSKKIVLYGRRIRNFAYCNKAIKWGGQNTLLIMGYASIVIMVMNHSTEYITINKTIFSGLKHILLWCILYVLSIVINKFMPIMVGKTK